MSRRTTAGSYRWRRTACAALATIAMASAAAWGAEPTILVAAGSGSNLGATSALAATFSARHPHIQVQVPKSIGSTGGIRAAADGAIAIGLISRSLREDERLLGLTVVPYARTAIVLGAHPTVSDDGLSSRDLVEIYAGRKSRWADGREIVVLTREPGDSSIEVLQRLVPGFKEVYAESFRAKRWSTLFTDQEMAQTLSRTPFALGITDVGALTTGRLPIKVLRVDGVAGTLDQVRAGRYPLVKTLALVFRPDRMSPAARAFVDFVLSGEGAAVLVANGYLPRGGP